VKSSIRISTALIVTFVLLTLACNLSGSTTIGLRLNSRAKDGSVSGIYQYSKDMDSKSIIFSVSADGKAEFQLEDEPSTPVLTVDFSTQKAPFMTWQGNNLDGLGGLSSKEKQLLDGLLDSELSYALAMIPMDLSCQGEEKFDTLQLAALLFPLQMRFKYQITDRANAAMSLTGLSVCDFGEEQTDKEMLGKPSMISITPSNPVPVVIGYFPFDEIGAVETANTDGNKAKLACLGVDSKPITSLLGFSTLSHTERGFDDEPIQNEWGPCEAKCRGSCGPDCTHNNCSFSIEERCEKNQEGQNSGFFSLVHVYDCGLHPACVKHDACYDDCNRKYGCETWAAAICMHAGVGDPTAPLATLFGLNISCDRITLNEEDPSNVKDWMRGYGPLPDKQVYEYHDKEVSFEYDPITCPLQEEQAEDEPESEEVEANPESDTFIAGRYLGEEIDTPPGWELVESTFFIDIADDGTVSGSRVHKIKKETVSTTCMTYYESSHTTSFSGQIVGTRGFITVTTETKNLKDDSGCSWGSYDLTTYENVCDQSLLTISGNNLEIVAKSSDENAACGGVFEAKKQ